MSLSATRRDLPENIGAPGDAIHEDPTILDLTRARDTRDWGKSVCELQREATETSLYEDEAA